MAPYQTRGSRLPLRMAAASLVLVGIAFIQNPGLLVADTKFDLAVRPLEFLGRALHLWDTEGAFGQLQNQAYGYLWPMGPFFVLGDVLGLPDWVVQRLWIAVVMVVAFIGSVLVSRALGVRSDLACLVAGFAFALSPRMISTLGSISIEAWPSALAPWVLLPLVVGARRGSPVRMAMLSGLAVAMVGGVNAAATAAVLPLGVLWLLTRGAGPRRRRLMLWWPVFTLLGTLWWLIPLFLLGAYSPPFLDFIESASVTTFPTTPFDALRGTSAWVPYLDTTWQGGFELLRHGYIALNSGLLLFLGLAGVALGRRGHRQFLVLALLTGMVLVTMGHEGSTSGWFSSALQAQLDGVLAPLRNVHKFDPVVRLPLVLGLALLLDRAMGELARMRDSDTSLEKGPERLVRKLTPAAVVGLAMLGVVGSTVPATSASLTTTRPVLATPGYWEDAASWLEERPGAGVALLAPGTGFGSYLWGDPRDEPMQWLAGSRWAVRNAIPLAPPGNIRMLDAFEARLAQGRPSTGLASYLRRAGVQHIVVRNDVRPSGDVPDPTLVRQAVAGSPGIELVRTFGPEVGGEPSIDRERGRLVVNGGWQSRRRAIEVFEVSDASPAVTADALPTVIGGPEDLLDLADVGLIDDQPTELAVDADPGERPDGPVLLTDGLQDRERFFGRVHDAYSALLTAGDVARSGNPVRDYALAEGSRWSTTTELLGVQALAASSSLSDSTTAGGARPGNLPYAAVDGDPSTSWVSRDVASGDAPWWQVTFEASRVLNRVEVTASEDGGRERVRVVTERGSSRDVLIEGGSTRAVVVPRGRTRWLRVEGVRGGSGRVTLAEVDWAGKAVQRRIVLPRVPSAWGAPDAVLLRAARDDRTGCVEVDGAVRCREGHAVEAEEPERLNRVLYLPTRQDYEVRVTATPRPNAAMVAALQRDAVVNVTGSSAVVPDLRASGVAAFDGDLGTTWTSRTVDTRPQLNLNWLGERTLRGIQVELEPGSPARSPRSLRLTWPGGSRTVELRDGSAELEPAIRTDRLAVRVLTGENATSVEQDGSRRELPIGIGEISLEGLGHAPLGLDDSVRRWPCGSGPSLTVNGAGVRTRLIASPAQLYAMRQVPAEPCATSSVDLDAGENVLSARGGRLSVPTRVVLESTVRRTVTEPAHVDFDASTRSVLPGSVGPYVALRENANAGWAASQGGKALSALVIDGWQQGWRTESRGEPVEISFAPERSYRIGLGLGAGALLLLLALTLVPGSRWPSSAMPSARPAAVPSVVLFAYAALCIGLIIGWWGIACLIAALAVAAIPRVRGLDALAWAGSGLLLVAAGGYFVRPWGSTSGWAGSWQWPHYLVALALSVAVVGALGRWPSVRRRMAGSSTRR